MKKTQLGLLILASALMSSCSTIKQTAQTAPVQATVTNFTVADLEVSTQKVSKTYSWSYNPFVPVSVENAKENTTANLLYEAGADILVEPQYVVIKRGWLRGGSVTVSGFPAKITDFHKMTEAEAEIVKNASPAKPDECKHKRFWIF